MKNWKVKLLERILRLLALGVLRKYKPQVVGVTGSVGKTSAKEAVALVLAQKYDVSKNEKNYNNEIGLPLAVLGAEAGGRSALKWLLVLWRWLLLMLGKQHCPRILVLEMGVDRPGDMGYLLSFLRPHVGILTNVYSSHIEFFKTRENIAKEKGLLIGSLSEEGWAILNADEPLVVDLQDKTKAKVLTFGFSPQAQVRAENEVFHYTEDGRPDGISFKLAYEGRSIPVRLKHVLAKHQVYAALSGIAAGIALKLNLVEITQALENFYSPPGRLNLLDGMGNSILIDDTYNASPASTGEALKLLGSLKAKRKIAALGDMLELGDETKEAHRQIGILAAQQKIENIILVGERMKHAYSELKDRRYGKQHLFHFDDPQSAGLKLREMLQAGDLVLVKGSQGMRMEKVVEEAMAEPEQAAKLLARQTQQWRKRPFVKP